MSLTNTRIRAFDRATSFHALLVTCACAVLLFLGFSTPRGNWPAFNFSNSDSARDQEIDSALQEAATAALGQRDGTIIIMDPQTGRVRAAVNAEGAYGQAMMPGSTIKPFTTLAALRAGLIDEDSHAACPGRFTGLSFSLPCVHANHLPPFTPAKAIAYSCNYYFATLGRRLGRDQLIETLRPFGFGQPTGLDRNEATGLIKPCETGDRARIRSAASDHASQQSDCAAREALGESDHILVTPIQLMTAYAALVNGGRLVQPQVANADGFNPIERSRINISADERRVIIQGMAGAVRYGTARKAHLDSLPLYILGKTGTALPSKGFRTNGWFIGLAGPAQSVREPGPSDIRLAVLVLLPRAHGAEAATLSKPIFEAYANAFADDSGSDASYLHGSATTDQFPVRNSESLFKVRVVTTNITHELSLEDYVLGVLRTEGSMETEPEALKALAIAIRGYALKNRGRHAKDGYDFCSTTHCQRFAADIASVPPDSRLLAALRATEGQVLLDDPHEVVDSYFGASCGGETANLGTLWGKNPPTYLRGVHDEFCVAGSHANWTDVIARADLLRALHSDFRTDVGGRLDRIVVSRRDESGRAEFITLEGERSKTVRGWDFKIIVGRVLGWNVLKSSRFDVARSGANFIFRGSGFGHGLGLCQEGAHVMAARGASYQRILEKYFPGTSVSAMNRVASESRESASPVLTAEEAEILAEQRRRLSLRSLRNPLRSLRLDSLAHHASANKLTTISGEHFRLTYPADVARRDANQVMNILESARGDFLRRVSAASISTNIPALEIRLNESTGDFTSRTGQPWWAAAATKGNRIELQPLAILKRRGVLNKTLRHELAHVVIDLVSHDRAPRWLEEGFAIYLAGEGRLFSHKAGRKALSTAELEKRLEHPGSQQEMRALYAQAYLAVKELVRNGGEASVWKKVAGN